MKTIVLGDTHGRSNWKLAINQDNPDRVIFIGDYFDSFHINTTDQINNFLDIIEYKKTSGKEVILLIGNHDHHYYPEVGNTGTSGYQHVGNFQIVPTIDANREHLQVAYQMNNFLFTHAGVSSEFMDNVYGSNGWKLETLVDDLNELFKYKPKTFDFNGIDGYGDDTWQTPFWIRPKSLMRVNKDTLRKQIIQVVGHTSQKQIDRKGMATGGKYYFIDTMDTSGEYLVIQDNQLTFNSVK